MKRILILLLLAHATSIYTQPNFTTDNQLQNTPYRNMTTQEQEELRTTLSDKIALLEQKLFHEQLSALMANKKALKKLIAASSIAVITGTIAILLILKKADITDRVYKLTKKPQPKDWRDALADWANSFFDATPPVNTQESICFTSGFFCNTTCAAIACALKSLHELLFYDNNEIEQEKEALKRYKKILANL